MCIFHIFTLNRVPLRSVHPASHTQNFEALYLIVLIVPGYVHSVSINWWNPVAAATILVDFNFLGISGWDMMSLTKLWFSLVITSLIFQNSKSGFDAEL